MVSRRKFFSIFIMMAVLLFMFQFSHIVRENSNSYKVNQYIAITKMNGSDRWNSESGKVLESAVYVGNTDSKTYEIVKQWGEYTKRKIFTASSLEELSKQEISSYSMILLDGKNLDYSTKDLGVLTLACNNDVNLVFCNLPDADVLSSNTQLADLLGIASVKGNVTTKGIQLFDGFLLGGEITYQPSVEKEKKFQNMELNMPWYLLGKGTKTYMVGVMDEEEVVREQFPAIIWSHQYGNAKVFGVNGSYLEDESGLGILSALDYEANDMVLYPVINANNFCVSDFPGMANENDAKMQEYYSRNATTLDRDVLWPGIMAMATQNEIRLTAFLTTKYNYDDEAKADDRFVSFYLQQLSEIRSEAGKSYHFTGNTTLLDKAVEDQAIYSKSSGAYDFRTAFFMDLTDADKEALNSDKLDGTHTVAVGNLKDLPPISYATDKVMALRATAIADQYSYQDDFRVRSLSSALGYKNTLITMSNVIWPQTEEDRWENYFDQVVSNITTFWNKGVAFESTTLSECDYRTRVFLNLGYEWHCENDVIEATVSNVEQDAWFVLRTHGKDIVAADGAEYTKLEKDAYLVHSVGEKMQLTLGKSEDILEYSTTKGEE